MRICSVLVLIMVGSAGCGGAASTRPGARAAMAAPSGPSFAALVLQCTPDDVPESFVAERKGALDRAVQSYEETRGVVLTTLSLYLSTGRWAGEQVRVVQSAAPPRVGSEDECRLLRGVALGSERATAWPRSGEALAVAGLVTYAYVPAPGSAPLVRIRLAALLVRQDGTVQAAAPAEVSVEYARKDLVDRSSQEVAQELMEQLGRELPRALRARP